MNSLAGVRTSIVVSCLLGLPALAAADVQHEAQSPIAAPGVASSAQDADPLAVCVAAHRTARTVLERQTLIEVRAELRTCAAPGCPIAIRAECTEWLNEAERQVPTWIFSATSDAGDIDEARVFVDGSLAAERLDGHPREAQPGPHVITFELADGRRRDLRVVIGIGEKDRIVRASFSQPSAIPAPRAAPDAAAGRIGPRHASAGPLLAVPSPARHESRLGMILGLAALGGAVVAGGCMYAGIRARNQAEERCAPFCSESEVNHVRRWFILADVIGVAAVATGGASLYVFLSNVDGRKQPNAAFTWRGEF